MAYEHREGQFTLFRRDKKGNERAPDYSGDGLVNGVLSEASIWRKTDQDGNPKLDRDGNPMLSMTIKAKPAQGVQAGATRPPVRAAAGRSFDDMDSDIPFAPAHRRGDWSAC